MWGGVSYMGTFPGTGVAEMEPTAALTHAQDSYWAGRLKMVPLAWATFLVSQMSASRCVCNVPLPKSTVLVNCRLVNAADRQLAGQLCWSERGW